jgi:hypothetical protein
MSLPLSEARAILAAPKILLNIGEWIPKQKGNNPPVVYEFEARIRGDSSIPRGVWFRIAVRNVFTTTASFQLECDQPHVKSHIPLYRLDWRPLRTHSNGYKGPKELHGLHFERGETHEHFCFDHGLDSDYRIKADGVGPARKMSREFDDFLSALEYVCGTLNIQNPEAIPELTPQLKLI